MSDEPGGVAEGAPRVIEELAQMCVQYVERALDVTLDFTPETLGVLDHYLASVRESVRGRPEVLPLLARVIGAYFGEVVCRRLPAFWQVSGEDVHTWRLCSKTVFLWFNPIGVAYDALFESTEHDGPSSQLRIAPEEREAVERRFAALPEMDEAEYYLATTRFEALEIATDALRAQMIEGGSGGVEFDAGDYETETLGPS